jgi:hypothetical protein
LLFVIAILLVLIFWELSKINSRLKKTLVPPRTSGRTTNIKNPEIARPKLGGFGGRTNSVTPVASGGKAECHTPQF